MTIDGNLSDWSNVTAISLADNSGRTGGVDNTARVKLAWDDTYLYAAYDVSDTELLALQTTRDHADIYKDDEIEFFIDPQGDGASATSMTSTDYQFLTNVREARGDSRGTGTSSKDESYNATSFLAEVLTDGTLNVSGTDVGYTVELRISWADLGVTPSAGHFMRIDPVVGDRDGTGAPPVQSFDWAGLTNFNNPSAWKDVQLVNPPPPVSAYNIVKVGGSAITVDGNRNDWTGVSEISMADDPARGAAANSAKVKLAWTDTHLYAMYDVTDTELLAVETVRDGDIYKDDEVELYLDPQGDGASATSMTTTDYQLLANIRDVIGDARGTGSSTKDASFNPSSFIARATNTGSLNVTGTDVGYVVELSISWDELGVVPTGGHFMRIDAVVGDRDGSGPPPVESFDWAAAPSGNYNNPSAWKDVKLVVDATAPALPTNLVLTEVSSSQIDVSWTGSASSDVAKYKIYRGTTGTPTLLTTVSGSPYQNNGLTAGTSYTYQVSAVDAAGNESAKTAPASASTTGPIATGRPFGPIAGHQWATNTTLSQYMDPFTLSEKEVDPGNGTTTGIVPRMAAAQNMGLKMMLVMTGGGHHEYMTDFGDGQGSKFDRIKWSDTLQKFNTTAIKNAIAARVADGTVVAADVMDEPYVNSAVGTGGGNTWGKAGTMTKVGASDQARWGLRVISPATAGAISVSVSSDPAATRARSIPAGTRLTFLPGANKQAILTAPYHVGDPTISVQALPTALATNDHSHSNSIDNMARETKNIFSTLPVWVTHQWILFHPAQKYLVIDGIIDQYNSVRGDVTNYKNTAVAGAVTRDGHKIAFSINVLDGGYKIAGCPVGQTGGEGTYGDNCIMTPAQVRDYAVVLAPPGPGFFMWKYDDSVFSKDTYRTEFSTIAAAQAARGAMTWRR